MHLQEISSLFHGMDIPIEYKNANRVLGIVYFLELTWIERPVGKSIQ